MLIAGEGRQAEPAHEVVEDRGGAGERLLARAEGEGVGDTDRGRGRGHRGAPVVVRRALRRER